MGAGGSAQPVQVGADGFGRVDQARPRTVQGIGVDAVDMPRAGGRQPQRLPGGQVPGRVLGASHPGQHGLRAGGQHVFQRDLRGDDGCLPEDVDAAADAQRVADDAAVVQGVDGVQARLDADAHGPAVGIARRQGGQAGAQLFGGGPRLRLGAEQRAQGI
ncbi:hypothetical protein G6F31_019146 [Rhizopus arrhizus]|nr:hypothetical protein G6F31_019146 [Rhizopus arrhizus]